MQHLSMVCPWMGWERANTREFDLIKLHLGFWHPRRSFGWPFDLITILESGEDQGFSQCNLRRTRQLEMLSYQDKNVCYANTKIVVKLWNSIVWAYVHRLYKVFGSQRNSIASPPPPLPLKASIGGLRDTHYEPEQAEMVVVKVKGCGATSRAFQKRSEITSDCFGDDN